MQVSIKQLWQNLKAASAEPEKADWHKLWLDLEQAIGLVPRQQQLQVVAEAIFKIVEIYAQRAHLILATLEVTDNSTGPILSNDFLAGLMRQTMTLDLSDLVETDPYPKPRWQSLAGAESSLCAAVEHSAVLTIVEQLSADETLVEQPLLDEDKKQTALSIAHDENVSAWVEAISQQMQQHHDNPVSLHLLHQDLGIPLVEVWLGLLLGGLDLYHWQQHGDFYCHPHDLFLRKQ